MLPVLAAVLLMAACKAPKGLLEERAAELPHRSPAQLTQALLERTQGTPQTLGAKADIRLTTDGKTRSSKAHLRLVCDSAIWISVMPALGIEVARLLLTRDSLKLIDKLSDSYWIGDTAQAAQRFGLPVDLEFVQQALLGNPIQLDPEGKYRVEGRGEHYMLYNKEARRLARAVGEWEVDSLATTEEDSQQELYATPHARKETPVFLYWIDPDSLWVDRVLIGAPAHDQQVDVRYMDRKWVDGASVPTRITLSLSATGQYTNTAVVQLDRIRTHVPLELPFRIPPKYTPMH